MNLDGLDDVDRDLVGTAVDAIRAHHDPEKHTTGVALRAGSGEVYTGLSLKAATAASDVHAEPVAVARAVLAGETAFDTCVAVQLVDGGADAGGDPAAAGTRIVSPCGSCREVLKRQCPGLSVIVAGEEGPEYRTLADLLPD